MNTYEALITRATDSQTHWFTIHADTLEAARTKARKIGTVHQIMTAAEYAAA